jgi:SAM-dependent methyltransferase
MRYTGERLVPDKPELQGLLIEDLAKFRFASQFAIGKVVLDAGCGAGQGSAYLAQSGAKEVIAIDISEEAIRYAYDHYRLDNLRFSVMDCTYLGFGEKRFDFVCSIEVIEHLRDRERYLLEMHRVLKPDGIFFLSTPNKRRSSPTPGSMWPFHMKEFYPDELQQLLTSYFKQVDMWGQCVPIYERHPLRKVVRFLAPVFKPILPHRLRTTILPTVHQAIKSELTLDDVLISQDGIGEMPTLIAICRK